MTTRFMTAAVGAMAAVVAACGAPGRGAAAPLGNATTAAAAPDAIVPGRGVGALALGGSATDAAAAMGRAPDHVVTTSDTTALVWMRAVAADGDGYEAPKPEYEPLRDTLVALVVDGHVVAIEVSEPRFRTADGAITTGATVDAMAHLPHETRTARLHNADDSGATPASKHYVWYDDQPAAGVAVKYGAWGNLAPDPITSRRPEAIVVHAPGAPLVLDPVDSLPYAGHADASYALAPLGEWVSEGLAPATHAPSEP